MPKFRKKPVELEAFRFGHDAVPDWFVREMEAGNAFMNVSAALQSYAHIKTLEGTMRAGHGDWIIRGVKGEVYPCKPDIFEQLYEPA